MTPDQRSIILVCEAHEGLQEAFRLLLEDWAAVRLVATADDCLTVLESGSVTVLIYDVDGQVSELFTTLEAIRAQHPKLRVVLVAGEFDLDRQVAALRYAPVSFVIKPFAPQALAERLQVLAGYRASTIRTRILRMPIQSADQTLSRRD